MAVILRQQCACNYQESCTDGILPSAIGDGLCNNKANINECSYDFGDCCPFPNLVGNSVCNDESNHPECNYDGGDCCLTNINKGNCSECTCYASGAISSPGFPKRSIEDLDLTWLIKVAYGQLVKINSIHFVNADDPKWLQWCRQIQFIT